MKRNKIILVAALAMVFVGLVISGAAMAMGTAMENDIKEMKEYTATSDITKINIVLDIDDVNIVGSSSDKVKVTYYTSNITECNIKEENKTLTVESTGKKGTKWYDFIDFDFSRDNKVTIEVPKELQTEIISEVELGDTEIIDIKGKVDIKNACGDIKVSGCDFTDMKCIGQLGDIEIDNSVSTDMVISQECGDIELDKTTGNMDVTCELGDINIDRISGDKLKFDNSCGDIEGTIAGSEGDYKITTSKSNTLKDSTTRTKTLDVNNNCGDIDILFVK